MTTTGERQPGEGTLYEQIQASPEFVELRRRLRRFVFPMSAVFLVWYLLYVLLAAYEPEFMSIKLLGNLNVGLLIGVLQFVSTFVITTVYVRYANKHLDPAAEQIRTRFEGDIR
ncbi:MAG: hypothetical protein QOD82_2809 [Pseudonocardiales bacterium]|nr:hypothetical protein [Pseudonocardiales bacterium]